MIKQAASKASPLRAGLGSEIDKIPGSRVAVTEDGGLGLTEEGLYFVKVAGAAFGGEREAEAPKAGAESSEPGVEGFVGRVPWGLLALGPGSRRGGIETSVYNNSPQRNRIIIWSRRCH